MFEIGDKVKVDVDSIYRIGTVDDIIINPATKIVIYMIQIPFVNECIGYYEDEIIEYHHSHISTTFSRKSNEKRLNSKDIS